MQIAKLFFAVGSAALLLLIVQVASAQGPAPKSTVLGAAFTYQGQLKSGGSPYTGACDFQFRLYDATSSGNQIGTTQTASGVAVTNGLFAALLDFGMSAFNGDPRFLDVAVRCPAGSNSYTSLTPRQSLTPAPYALYAANAASAASWSGALVGDVTGTQTNTVVTRLQGRAVASAAPGNGQVLGWNGSQWTPLTLGYQNVIVVAKNGGNFATLAEGLNSITTASDTNRFLVKVMPGVYNEQVTMKPYVDIEGSGENTTKIRSGGSPFLGGGTVVGASNAELRFITVENTGGNSVAVAVFNMGTSPRLTQITATAYGGTTTTVGIYNASGTTEMTNVTASGTGGTFSFGVYNDSSSATIQSSKLTGGNGIHNWASGGTYTVTVNHSQIKGTINSISSNASFTTRVGASRLEGGPIAGGTTVCAGVYDENYVFYPGPACP